MQNELKKKERLLKLAGSLLNSIIKGLNEVDLETRKKIMQLCGETCAGEELSGGRDHDIAKKIAEERVDEEEILKRANRELLWCGAWLEKTTLSKPHVPNVAVHLRKTKW